MAYHLPVMLKECLEGLAIKPDGIYVDVTFGGGGHSKEILKQLTTGKLLVFDQDEDAKKQAEAIDSSNFEFIAANFRHIKKYLRLHGVKQVDGILGDFGVSSHQIDSAERGFSTRFNADLDMRMSKQISSSAKDLVNTYSVADLHKILGIYGEIKNAKTAAAAIVTARDNNPIITIEDLKEALASCTPRGREFKYFAQVFQAIRIEVNEELKVIEEFLEQVPDLLAPNGRVVLMSYHSLEDRLVKNFFRSGNVRGNLEKDFYGNLIKPLNVINRKPLEASEEEKGQNPRSRSAKLRIAYKPEE